jgi:hypothetical protein
MAGAINSDEKISVQTFVFIIISGKIQGEGAPVGLFQSRVKVYPNPSFT